MKDPLETLGPGYEGGRTGGEGVANEEEGHSVTVLRQTSTDFGWVIAGLRRGVVLPCPSPGFHRLLKRDVI